MPEKEAQRVLEKSQAATQEEAIKIFNEHKRRLVKLRKEKVSGKFDAKNPICQETNRLQVFRSLKKVPRVRKRRKSCWRVWSR